jgi:hypothetical protein
MKTTCLIKQYKMKIFIVIACILLTTIVTAEPGNPASTPATLPQPLVKAMESPEATPSHPISKR